MSTALVASPNVATNGHGHGAGALGEHQPHLDSHLIAEDSDNGTCPAPDTMLDIARGHEAHHEAGDVSAHYHEQEGADTEVGKGEEDADTDGPILFVVMVPYLFFISIMSFLTRDLSSSFASGIVHRVYRAQESPRSAPRWRLRSGSRSPTRMRCTPRPTSRR